MNPDTYAVTFYRETGDQAEDVEIRDVTITSPVEVDDLAAGDWDAHELITCAARLKWSLDKEDGWEASHVTLPDGEVAQVPAGL